MNKCNEKKWYLSKGVLGGIVSLLSLIGGFFGYTVDAESQTVIANSAVITITAITGVIGGITAIIGRVQASQRIGK